MRNSLKILIALATVIVVVATTMIIFRGGGDDPVNTELVFHTSPREVDVMVDGRDYGTVEAGQVLAVELTEEATIEVSREGFEPYETTTTVTPGATNELHVALLPETDEAWAMVDEEDELETEYEATERYLEDAENAYQEHPILEDLPEEAQLFSAYQGLTEDPDHDFGIHLHLYQESAAEGRDAFEEWMSDNEYDVEDYDVIETIEDDAPPTTVPEPPTMEELEEATAEEITIPEDLNPAGLSPDELAILFAEATTTWDAAEDGHHSESLLRATSLMTTDQAETTEPPHRPSTTTTWRNAAQTEARSQSWIHSYETQDQDGDTAATIEVCWAWISEESPPAIEGPRTYELTINDDPAIAQYTYQDPDPFVDNTNTPCEPDDA